MRYQIASQLSEHIAETPEGYLLCLGVPVARTGELEYAPDVVPIEARGDGPVLIMREPEDVFAPEAIASFEGKPTTVDHPEEDVTPKNWSELAVGHAQNLRRGEGVQADLLLADLLISDKEAIDLVRGGLREISCGYDADYEEEAPGRGRQRNIRGNHIALVRRGRCGPRCKINDNREDNMKKPSFKDQLAAFKKSLLKAVDGLSEEGPDKKPEGEGKKPEEGQEAAPVKDDATEERLAALESKMEEISIALRQLAGSEGSETSQDGEDPDGEEGAGTSDEEQDPEQPTGDGEKPCGKTGDGVRAKARDARARTVDADTKARAAVLAPRIKVMDGDKRCAVQRAALRVAIQDKAIGEVVNAALRGSTMDSCDGVTLEAAFVAASEVAKVQNNRRTADGLITAKTTDFGKTKTPAEINEANRKHYADRAKGV